MKIDLSKVKRIVITDKKGEVVESFELKSAKLVKFFGENVLKLEK